MFVHELSPEQRRAFLVLARQVIDADHRLAIQEVERLDRELGLAFVPLTRDGDVWVGGDVVRAEPAGGPFLRCDDPALAAAVGVAVGAGASEVDVFAAVRKHKDRF